MRKVPSAGSNKAASELGKTKTSGAISRRIVLGGAAVIGVGAVCGLTATRAQAQSKQKQAEVQYQNSPKGADKCSGCALFAPPNACQGVEGEISPEGWCSIYTPKG